VRATTLEYRTHNSRRAGFATCVALAGNLLGLALCLVVPIALSLAGVYWENASVIAVGFVISAVCFFLALLLAVTAVERICDLMS
jgi:uncharacterized membrane protein YjfL (UPF0719 family)